ncbi:HAD-like domain [Phytophthora cactorum]|nr:HAD-like domain [Phytophthora cactorum]
MAATSTASAGMSEAQSLSANEQQRPPRRLSVTDANALANFSQLQAHFRDHRLVIFLDYDGTLTPIVNDPALALLSPTMKNTLEKLREKFITGVITGRSLDKIQKFVSIPQLYYAGSHGFDIEGPDGTSIKNQVAAQFLTDLHGVRDELGEQIKDIAGAEVEDNIFSVSLHYRWKLRCDACVGVDGTGRRLLTCCVLLPLRMNEGKMVYEFKPKIDWNKGKALLWLLQALGLDELDDVYTIYIGDDTTDEDAFRLFQAHYNRKGVGIVVTEESVSTDASFTLRDTSEVCEFLNRLITCGDHASSSPSSPQPTDPPPAQQTLFNCFFLATLNFSISALLFLRWSEHLPSCAPFTTMRRFSRVIPRAVIAASQPAPQHRSFNVAGYSKTNDKQWRQLSSVTDTHDEHTSITQDHREFITLRWQDGKRSKFHLLHLRTWCPCSECGHSTGQRVINCSEINKDELDIEKVFVKGETLNIVWNDHHESSFSCKWLRENSYSKWALDHFAHDMATSPLALDAPVPSTEYARMMDTSEDKGLYEALRQVVDHGFTVIRDTPSVPGAVKTLAERIAPISHSFQYGDVFDVVAEPTPVNIAYTTVYLKSHVDLAYYESPPGLQFLHALRFDKSVKGGESTFVDVFAVAEEFRRLHPKHFATFCRVPATFKKHHLTRPLRVPFDDVMPYYDAYRVFHELVEGGMHRYEFRLKQGDTVIFNQRRVLHGRKQFTPCSDGVRHLQGTYINIDDALCRYNVLRTRFGADDPAAKNRRVANGNFS